MPKKIPRPKIKYARDEKGNLISWQHPGGKLIRLGSGALTDAELLAIIIGTGAPGISAEEIGEAILHRFQSFKGMSNRDMKEYLEIKGVNQVKFTRIAACWEIALRIVKKVLADQEKYADSD